MAQLKSRVVAVFIENAMHCRLRGKPNPNYSSSQMSTKPQMPLQTFAVF